MNNTNLYKKLIAIKEEVNGYGLHDDLKLDKLIDDVKNEMMSDKVIEPDEKKRLKAIIKYLNKNDRDVLKNTTVKEINGTERQLFTNFFTAFVIAPREDLPIVNEGYPDIARLFNNIESDITLPIDYKKVVYATKLKKKNDEPISYVKVNDKITVHFSSILLKEVFEIMGTDKLKFYYQKQKKSVYFVNEENNECGLIMPFNPSKDYSQMTCVNVSKDD